MTRFYYKTDIYIKKNMESDVRYKCHETAKVGTKVAEIII